MTRTRLASISLPVFIVAAVVVAITAFGLTRWLTADDGTTLPPLSVARDTAAAAPGALDTSKLYQQRVATTVTIEAQVGDGTMNGAGVVVDTSGVIVTASHVVQTFNEQTQDVIRASSVVVTFEQGDELLAVVESIDSNNDLAILKVNPAELTGLVAAPLAANSDSILVGAEVAAIGAPFGHDFTISPGNVTGLHRVTESRINASWSIPDALQFDAPINKGNSGGPLFDARGQVIGIVQQISSESGTSAGVAFAVPSNIVRRALAQWRSDGRDRITYAWTGIVAERMTPQLDAQYGLGVSSGALVQTLQQGPALRAGLQAGRVVTHLGRPVTLGDVIVELDGQPVRSAEDLQRITGMLQPDTGVELTYVRGGERRSTTIVPSLAT